MIPIEHASDEQIYTVEDVQRLRRISRYTIWRRREGRFPRAVKISKKTIGFRAKDLRAYIADPENYVVSDASA